MLEIVIKLNQTSNGIDSLNMKKKDGQCTVGKHFVHQTEIPHIRGRLQGPSNLYHDIE